MKKVTNLLYKMFTQNTGKAMCDSGDYYGRNYEKNSKLSKEQFLAKPEATLEINNDEKHGIELYVTINLFHHLNKELELDNLCETFNRRKVADWNSDEFYGVSKKGEDFLLKNFDLESESFNSYNWESNFTQICQGRIITNKDSGDKYAVLQIHGGCDARGGYTDAKLFKLRDEYSFLDERAGFDVVDWMGEFINHEGQSASEEDRKQLVESHKIGLGQSKTIEGYIFE